MKLDNPLTSEHLLLRTLGAGDATDRYLAWLSDPDVNRYLEVRFAPPGTLADLAAFIEVVNDSVDSLMLGIFLRLDGRHIGNVKLGPIDRHHRRADIGLLIGDKTEWGKGHASAAIALLASYAFAQLELEKLTAGCYSGNEGSRQAFINAGFVEEGRQVSQWIADGMRQDGILLGCCNPAERQQTLAVLQARCSSIRLPGKVLLPLLGKPMLARQIERLKRSRRIDVLVVATSDHAGDDAIAALCAELGVACFRGALDDVLDRFYKAALQRNPATVVRLTGDCPLTDPDVVDGCIDFFREGNFDYASNAVEPSFPDGLDVEVMRFDCLAQAWREARLPSEREHVTPFIHTRPQRYRIGNYRNSQDLSHLRWTVDEPDDLEFVRSIYEALYPVNSAFATFDILALLESRPELATLNAGHQRNAGLLKSQQQDAACFADGGRYKRSEALLERALKTIPLGSQTFSKSKTQYPLGISPYFITRGDGCRVWDVDGNEYIDFVSSLASITLGYSDPDVNAAVRNQLEDGVIFSLPHPLEMEVAERLVKMVPCAEMVRFGKNGSDATSGAIRLSRAYTGRDRVAVCGYHGWQDWYIGSTARHRGVPQCVRDLTQSFPYNDLAALAELFKAYPGEFAAVIIEPMNVVDPVPGYLAGLRELTHAHGALLVFDETITGFRFANGGAQEYFGVIPDLATFGKGLANGYPISAVAGRADVMKLMEEIFFSFTFGGETLSLAAAAATLDKLVREPVTRTLAERGEQLRSGVTALIVRHGLGECLSIAGHSAWTFLVIKDTAGCTMWESKTLLMQELLARGILWIGTHNLNYAHGQSDIAQLLDAYDQVFPMLRQAIETGRPGDFLRCEPLQPLFKIR